MEHKPRRLELVRVTQRKNGNKMYVTNIHNTEDGQRAQRGLQLDLTGSTSEGVSGDFQKVIF